MDNLQSGKAFCLDLLCTWKPEFIVDLNTIIAIKEQSESTSPKQQEQPYLFSKIRSAKCNHATVNGVFNKRLVVHQLVRRKRRHCVKE